MPKRTPKPASPLRLARERAGLTQAELGARMVPPVTQDYVSRVERGAITPSVQWLVYRAAPALGCEPRELVPDIAATLSDRPARNP